MFNVSLFNLIGFFGNIGIINLMVIISDFLVLSISDYMLSYDGINYIFIWLLDNIKIVKVVGDFLVMFDGVIYFNGVILGGVLIMVSGNIYKIQLIVNGVVVFLLVFNNIQLLVMVVLIIILINVINNVNVSMLGINIGNVIIFNILLDLIIFKQGFLVVFMVFLSGIQV